jgi:hypothetical protein
VLAPAMPITFSQTPRLKNQLRSKPVWVKT